MLTIGKPFLAAFAFDYFNKVDKINKSINFKPQNRIFLYKISKPIQKECLSCNEIIAIFIFIILTVIFVPLDLRSHIFQKKNLISILNGQ